MRRRVQSDITLISYYVKIYFLEIDEQKIKKRYRNKIVTYVSICIHKCQKKV